MTSGRFRNSALLFDVVYRCCRPVSLIIVGARKRQQDRKEANAKMPNQKAFETWELAAHCHETKECGRGTLSGATNYGLHMPG